MPTLRALRHSYAASLFFVISILFFSPYAAKADTDDPYAGSEVENSAINSKDADLVDIHRFTSLSGSYFFTNSTDDVKFVLENLGEFYNYDGIIFRCYRTQSAGTTPLYRMYSKYVGTHFYTAQASDRQYILDNLSDYYDDEGVMCYVANASDSENMPVHQLYHECDPPYHLYTASADERDELLSNACNTDDGVGFYVWPWDFTTPSLGHEAGEEWTDRLTGMEFVWIPGGTFQMGSEDGYADEQPVHTVTVDGFWMGKYEVTQKQWVAIAGSNPSSTLWDSCPVERITWLDAKRYIKLLNRLSGHLWADYTFRLPTGAEWEYACRAGTTTTYYWGDSSADADDYAWYCHNSEYMTHPVGQKLPNQFGLYDMAGNVYEWCQDCYLDNYYSESPQDNPTGPASGNRVVMRGGSCGRTAFSLRCAFRDHALPYHRSWNTGFRLVRTE